jgi:hypothetical protein
MRDQQLRETEVLQRVFVYATLRQITGLAPAVHVDLLPSSVAAPRLAAIAERLVAGDRCPSLVETLVLDAEGQICTYSANAAAAYGVARIDERPLRAAWDEQGWRDRAGNALRQVAEELSRLDEATLVNWFDWVVAGAREDTASFAS